MDKKRIVKDMREEEHDMKKLHKEERKMLMANAVKKKMKKQGPKDREDESLGMRRGKESTKEQSYKDRRDESRGMRRK